MKKIAFILVCLMIGFTSYAQQAVVSFDETVHDFGTIAEKGGRVTHTFEFTNISDKPITVSRVKASCGCTSPSWTKTAIEPGAKGSVSATYSPAGRPGKFNKSLTVTLSEGPVVRLSIKGEVTKAEVKPEDTYPVNLGNNFLVKSSDLNFGNITPGSAKKVTLEVFNNNDTEQKFQFNNLPAHISSTGITIPSKTANKVEITLQADKLKNEYGAYKGALTTETKGIINYKTNILEDYSKMSAEEKGNAGKINVNDKEITLDAKNTSYTLKISNSGKSNLNIKAIKSSDNKVSVNKTNLTIKPEKIGEVKIKYSGKPIAEGVSVITIYSDDPNTPIKTVRVSVKP
ncbi:DUF1573 domain-containing protein [Bacteroidales bacterium OttesenSCG-928-M11]|nr:DUF1573 domain-containing protein [Bacteroidales bacterium OttesenSCG-928-M11]